MNATFTTIDKALVATLPFILMTLTYFGTLPFAQAWVWPINMAVAALTPLLVWAKNNKPAA